MTHDDIWNHNLAYQSVLLREVPPGCRSALDVGCGQGFLLSHLATRVEQVVGIDRHAPSLKEAARRNAEHANVLLVEGDAMTYEFDTPFDVVFSVAVVHHLPLEPGLVRMKELTAPGGVLGVVGLASNGSVLDHARDAVGVVQSRFWRLRRGGYTMVTAPICDPEETYQQVREVAEDLLPGARYRRHNMFRYTITWTRPRG